MRTPVVIAMIILSMGSTAQSVFQIADTTKKWNTLSAGYGAWLIMCCEKTKTNAFDGDTIIGDLSYLKVFESIDSNQSNWEFKGFLREDTVSHRVYYRSGNNEGLLYDFDVEINDTVIIQNYYQYGYSSSLICTSIDSVLLNGEYKNRYLFSDLYSGYPEVDTWIEGIGSICGLFCSGIYASGMTGGYRNLLCCSQSDSTIYMDTTINSCYVDDFFPNIVQHSYDTGYVGESYEYQLFLTDTSGISSFEWIYGYGPPSLQFDDGLLYGVPNSSGVFPCLIMIKNNDIDLITDHIESNIVILDPAFFPERSETKKLGITPNPFFSDFTVSISSMNNEKFLMECSDLTGKVIHSLVLQSENTRINGDEMYRGLYIITIKSINGKIIEAIKLIKK